MTTTKSPTKRSDGVPFDAILSYMRGLSYRQRRIFLWQRARPRVSRFLYKFRALFPADETSVDHMRDILVRSKLWTSSPLDFNDPFDMSAKFIAEGNVKEKRKRIRELLKDRGFRWKELEKQIPRIVAKPNADLSELAREKYRDQIASTGVYSFGGDPRSILMWSHYASNHTGVCLQFERAADPDTFLQAISVEYSEEYPEVNWITDAREGLGRAMLRKYVGWSYEKESRIILLGRVRQFLDFRPEALKGIIIGCRAKEDTITSLQALVHERSSAGFPPPTLYRAIQHGTEYKLVIKAFR